ncbi:hypothetical protein DUNSADRAFT_4830 [Dunaliella salina]|uniref:C-type lectin domain-containing protein n=1 Tax=Dunaliella salina TaxID=3046 RepID=A0ABQ7GRA4_DUNSA|nr:hypothetical protein DUNSADRAFT_4830 [Dunaliella salina]|eukprot:KAF5837107.1 hypothetical protein DUNSADRAFT_4830 [Dunaliella salina]
MVAMGAGNLLALFTTLVLAPLLALGDQHSVFSDIQVEALEQQPLQSDDEVFQGFASRGLLDGHLGTYPPTYPLPPIQPTEAVNYDGNTYQLYGLQEEDWKTFDMASEDCRSRRMNLATVSDGTEHESAMRALVNDYVDKNGEDYPDLKFWVGYKNMGEGLESVDGSDISYVAARLEGSDTCVYANRTAGDLQTLPTDSNMFTTTSCTEMYPYMCELSPCSICDTCVEKIRMEFTSQHNFGSDTAAATDEWASYCDSRDEYSDAQCDEATQAIAGSINVAGRPAALCGLLGDCDSADECEVKIMDGGPEEVEPIAFCTDTGVESGSIVGADVITNLTTAFNATDDDCLTSDDCDADEFCDLSGDASVKQCKTEDGLDKKEAKGVCTTKCELPFVKEAQRRQNLLFSDEDVCNVTAANQGSDECPAGFTCEEALDSCRVNFECNVIDGEAVLNGTECPGMCFRVALQLEDGNFTNDADAIIVQLNDLAQAFTAPCEEIFDDSSMELLGSATCSVSAEVRDVLMIQMSGDATVDVGSNLTLSSSQNTLRGYADPTNNFEGSITVDRCDSCTPPTPVLTGPASIREPCSGGGSDYGTVYIDGSSSFSASGRGVTNFTWGLDTASSECASSDALQNVITQASENSREFLELDNSTLTDMAENVPESGGSAKYCITLAVEDFLSKSESDAEHNFMIQSADSATPSVDVVLPDATTISTGLVLSASVDTSSVCNANEVAEYKWECEAEDGGTCPLLVDPEYSPSIVREITFSDLLTARITAGSSYRFLLSARLNDTSVDGPDGITEPSEPQASQVITFEADPLVALFTRDSPSGDYKRPGASQLITFDASASYDPSDPGDNVQPMRYTFSCQRPDGISDCFASDGDGLYTGDVNGAQWTVDLNKFVNDNDGNEDIFIMQVEVVKANREPATTTSTFRLLPQDAPTPVRARVNQFCDGQCPATSLSSEPLSFSVDILNEDDLTDATPSYSWTVNGVTVAASNLAGASPSADAASITIQGGDSILPRSGVIDVSCTVSVGDATGSAQTTVRLEGAPFCTNPNGCLIVTGAGNPPSQTFSDITFRVQARGFSGANALNYEFGFVDAEGNLQLTRVADSSPAAVLDAQQGAGREYRVYVKAIDSRNGGSSDGTLDSAQATFTLEEATDVDQAADDGASELDFEVLENTGSKSAVHSGMKKANAFKNAKANAGGNGGRRLLDDHVSPTEAKTTEGLQSTLRTLEGTDVRVADALGALTAISETTPSDTEQAILLAQIVRDAMQILDSNEFDSIGTVAVRQALSRLGLAANMLSEMCTGNCFTDTDDHWMIAMMVESTLDAAREVMSNSAASGVTTVAISAPIALAVSRNTIRATSTANVVFNAMVDGTTPEAGARFEDDTSANQFVNYCEDIDPDCASQERLALYLSHVTNPAIYTNSTDSFPGIPGITEVHFDEATSDPMAISGIFEVQFNFKDDGEAICRQDVDECNMVLTIPVSPDSMSMLDGKRAACVRITATNTESFTTEVVEKNKDVDSSSASLTCTVSRLGQYMLMSYTAPPSPPPPPSGTDGGDSPDGGGDPTPDPTPSSPPPSPAQPVDDPTTIPTPDQVLTIPEDQIGGECGGLPNKAITLELTFDLDAGDINDTDIQELEERLQVNLGRLVGLGDSGLNCPVQMTQSSQASGGNRRLLASTWDVAADLGNDTPARVVRKSRQLVGDTVQQDAATVQDTLLGDYTAQGGAVTVQSSSLTSSPNNFEGCANPDDTARQISATITIDFGNLLDSASAEQQETLSVEAASQMEEAVMNNITNYGAVVGDCPVLFSFGEGGTSASSGRRSLLQTDHQLAFATSDDANGDVVQDFYDSLGNVNFNAIDVSLAGNTYQVTGATLNSLSDALSSSATRVAMAASTMALAVLALMIASGIIL